MMVLNSGYTLLQKATKNQFIYNSYYRSNHFIPAALKLLKDLDKSNTTAASWADHKWNTE